MAILIPTEPGEHRPAVIDSGHSTDPVDLLSFIELEGFHDDWYDLGLGDADLFKLQVGIMLGPKSHPVVRGTGGLRKIRFSPVGWPTGKSGACRVGYVYFEEWGVVVLVVAYAKSERDNLSKASQKAIREMLRDLEEELRNRYVH